MQNLNSGEFVVGAFLSLKSANMVSKRDVEIYDGFAHDAFKMQSTLMIFLTFWARMLDIGNVLPIFKKKKMLSYGLFICVPSILSSFYFGKVFQEKTQNLDRKYTKSFLEFQEKNQTNNEKSLK